MYSSEVFLPYISLLIGGRLISEFLPILLQETRQAVMSMTWSVDVGSQGDSVLQAPKQKWFLRHDPLVPGFSRNLKPCRNFVKGLAGQQKERENDLLLSRKEVRVRTGGKGLVSTPTSCTAGGGSCSLREDGCTVHLREWQIIFFMSWSAQP